MLRASTILSAGSWSGGSADRISLDHQARHRRRISMTADGGLRFLLDLPHAVALREGDGLMLEDGRIVAVHAQPEPLMEVTAHDARHVAQLAWHLGNRHVPAAIEAGRILIAPDPVLRQMLAGLGASVRDVVAPFDPEPGAYAQQPAGHDHSHV